jgi:hypothetical protein
VISRNSQGFEGFLYEHAAVEPTNTRNRPCPAAYLSRSSAQLRWFEGRMGYDVASGSDSIAGLNDEVGQSHSII